jgi:hypothetical protein
MINRYGGWMDTNVVTPVAPNRCRVTFDWWLEPAALERLQAEHNQQRQQRVGDSSVKAVAIAAAETSAAATSSGSRGGIGPLEFTHPGAAELASVRESLASSHQVQVRSVQGCKSAGFWGWGARPDIPVHVRLLHRLYHLKPSRLKTWVCVTRFRLGWRNQLTGPAGMLLSSRGPCSTSTSCCTPRWLGGGAAAVQLGTELMQVLQK